MLPVGTVLYNRYRITRNLARGGMSNIYLCDDLRLTGKVWVVKEMAAQYSDIVEQQKAFEHFKREASLLATLEHRNMPKVIDYFDEHGNSYFVMEYVEGEDLSNILSRSATPLPERQVIEWGLQIATVLYFLHCQKPNPIIFRDIKPSNIMVSGNNVKLIDFGIARNFSPTKKGDTMRIGSPGYAPPEQYSGQTDPRSDIYSLGVTLYQLLTRYDPAGTQTPFKFPPIPSINPSVSPQLVKVIEKAVQIDPAARFQNAIEMKKALQACLGSDVTSQAAFKAPRVPSAPTLPYTPPMAAGAPRAGQPAPPPQTKAPRGGTPPGAGRAPGQQKHAISALKSPKKAMGGSLKRIAVALLLILIIAGAAVSLHYIYPGWWITLGDRLSALNLTGPSDELKYNRDYPEDILVRKGIMNLGRGEFKKAFENLEKVRGDFPDDGEALLYLNNAFVLSSGTEFISMGLEVPADGSRANPETRSIYRGAALAQYCANRKGGINGRKMQIVPFVTKADGTRLIHGLRKLFESQDLPFMIGGFLEKDLNSLSELFRQSERSLIDISRSSLQEMPPSILSIRPPDHCRALALGQGAAQYIKAKKIALLYYKDRESAARDAVKSRLPGDSTTVDLPFTKGEGDLPSIVSQITTEKPDLMIICGTASGTEERLFIGKLMAQLKKAEPVLLLDESLYYAWNNGAVDAGLPPDIWVLCSEKPGDTPSVRENYCSFHTLLYQSAPAEENCAVVFDAFQIFAMASDRAGASRSQTVEYLESMGAGGDYKGASGTLVFTKGKCSSTVWYAVNRTGKAPVIKEFVIP